MRILSEEHKEWALKKSLQHTRTFTTGYDGRLNLFPALSFDSLSELSERAKLFAAC